jgi:hypothetical protein
VLSFSLLLFVLTLKALRSKQPKTIEKLAVQNRLTIYKGATVSQRLSVTRLFLVHQVFMYGFGCCFARTHSADNGGCASDDVATRVNTF